MRKLVALFSALTLSAGLWATSIWSGSQDVHWDNPLTIEASKFASAQPGYKLTIFLTVNDGTNDAIEFKANGQKLPGTRFSLCQDWWETYDLFMTQDMIDSCKVYGMEIYGDNFEVTNVDLSEGKSANMKEGKAIWTGYFWVDSWSTLEVFKEALDAVKDWSKYSAMRFYSECPTTDNLIWLRANWEDADIIAKSDPSTDEVAGNPLKRYEGYAELDLTKVNPLTVINALSSDRLILQMDKQGSYGFNFTDVVLVSVPEQLTAPQVPTVDAANVKAIMCETYNNDLGYWPQGWGGCNWVDTCRAGVNIKYANTMAWDCFASDWQGAGVANYANLHFDIWFAEDGNAPIIKLEFNGTDPTAEITIPGEYKAGWNSVNVNVEETFGEQPMDNLKCLTVKVTKEGGAVAWANILFFNGEYTSQVSTGYCGDAPAECKYTEYENWQIKFGPDWTWSDNMTKVEDGLFKMEIEWDGTGFNIKSDENPIKQDWFPVEELVIGEEVIAPVIVDVYLKVIDDEHIRIGIGTNPGVGPTDAINIINTEDVPNGAIIKDGKVYIIRNGKLYNLQGSEIKNADEILKSIQF